MTEHGRPPQSYSMGHSDHETQRLMEQARLLDLPLRRLFEDAGIVPGMRVLDIGSGAGDVALTVANLVGPSGAVVGVDMNPLILETARERAQALHLGNVSFMVGDIREDLTVEGEFDAIVGRLVFMYLAEPGAVLRGLLRYVRPGGIVAFQEPQFAAVLPAFPPSPLLEQGAEWLRQAQTRSGANISAGLGLYQTFLEAGLPTPQMRAHAGVIVGPESPFYAFAAAGLRSLLSRIIEFGIATAAEVDIDNFEERLRAEFANPPRAAFAPPSVDAWTRKL